MVVQRRYRPDEDEEVEDMFLLANRSLDEDRVEFEFPEEDMVDVTDAESLAEALAEGTIDPNGEYGNDTLLTLAARLGAAESVEMLLDAGADHDLEANDGCALDIAITLGHLGVARVLLDRGFLPGNTPQGDALCIAIGDGNVEMVALLADYVVEFDYVDPTTGSSPLVAAVISLRGADTIAMVEVLVTNGADVDFAPEEGVTPLMEAADLGDMPLVQKLLDLGADPTLKDGEGYTALNYSATDEIKDLIRAGRRRWQYYAEMRKE